MIQDYNLVSFIPLCIDDPETVIELIRTVDRANGYINLQSSGDESVFKLVGKGNFNFVNHPVFNKMYSRRME